MIILIIVINIIPNILIPILKLIKKSYNYLGDNMKFKVGDLVTRKSYNNDMVFTIIEIDENICYLKGINIRLYADSDLSDLQKYDNNDVEEE